MMTKDEVSDLRSFIESLIERERELDRALRAKELARSNLEAFFYQQQKKQ